MAPNTLVFVSCRVDDLTGQPGRHDPAMAAQGWRDLELHVQNGQYECRRTVIANIVDQQAAQDPTLPELKPNLGKPQTCLHVGTTLVPPFEQQHPGWAVVAIGCPSPNIDKNTGEMLSYHIPSCPEYLPGTNNPMHCDYDDSAI
jgi:hypothetical protein